MEVEFSKGAIKFSKELSDLDRFVLDVVDILNSCKIRYVIVSGYIAILFGRPRATEVVDFLMENIDFDKFKDFISISKNQGFEVMKSPDANELYFDFLRKYTAIRLYRTRIFPNAEIKFAKDELNKEALDNPLRVILNSRELLISPLEQQVAYKLYLGARNDIQDARFIFGIFKDNLDTKDILRMSKILKVEAKFDKYLGAKDEG